MSALTRTLLLKVSTATFCVTILSTHIFGDAMSTWYAFYWDSFRRWGTSEIDYQSGEKKLSVLDSVPNV